MINMTTKTVLFPESLCYQVALLATGSARRHMYVNVCVRTYTICKCTHRTEIEAQTNVNYVAMDVPPKKQTTKVRNLSVALNQYMFGFTTHVILQYSTNPHP